MTIEITSDWHEVDAELARLESLPNGESIGILDVLLGAAFAATEAMVHVETGRLRASGEVHSVIVGKEWSGVIHFGDPGFTPIHKHTYGVVNYAIYEKRRGGSHNFFSELDAMDSLWAQAMLEILRG